MLPPEEKLRLLSMVDILEPLSHEEIKELSRRIPDTYVDQGRILYTPQEKSEALFMLKKGRVRIYRIGPTDQFAGHTRGCVCQAVADDSVDDQIGTRSSNRDLGYVDLYVHLAENA
jgi:hypothetical protein